MFKITVKRIRKHGLEVFQVFLDNAYVTEFLSETGAKGYARRLEYKLWRGIQ